MGKCSALHLLKYKRFCITSLVGFSKPCCKEYTVQNNNNNNNNNNNYNNNDNNNDNNNNNNNKMNMQWMCF